MVLRRFTKVVQDHAKLKSIRLKSFTAGLIKSTSIPIDVKINNILGTSLEKDEYIRCLKELGFDITDQIKIPTYRHDIVSKTILLKRLQEL